MNTDNRTNEKIETRKCSNQACPLRRAHSGPCAPSDWKPGAPSEAQVEAAARAMHESNKKFYPWMFQAGWEVLSKGDQEGYLDSARAALEAAAGVAPQAPEGRELDALRALVENRARVIEGFSGAPAEVADEQKAIARSIRRDLEDHDFEFRVAPVQPSSTVDEDALAEVIRRSYENEQGLKIRDDKRTARAVAKWLKEQGQ